MRLRWFGDARDYVKWDCIFENAQNRFVFYIPMLRRDVDPKCGHSEVQAFFDQRKSLDQFKELFPNRFEVFNIDKDYSIQDADNYFERVRTRLSELQKKYQVLIFIDPDTGIEPESGAKSEHLRCRDMVSIWEIMKPNDLLVIYQHASRNKNWKQQIKERIGMFLNIEKQFHARTTLQY